ncbi:MAG: division/cell wall cluster transcriptional repressor MraZ [Pirellulaceae bacterium]
MNSPFLQGEFRRTLDERHRLSLPQELLEPLTGSGAACILIKERAGALSLWSAAEWQPRLDGGVQLIHSKLEAGRLEGRIDQVQQFGRLLSTRHRTVQLAGRGRLVIPEGFREFLGVEPGGEVMVVGAALCVEVWQPAAWIGYLQATMPEFHRIFEGLST